MQASATRMKHCKMHSVAQPTTVNETAVQVPEWVFAAHGRAVVQYALNDCEGRQPQRATWQVRIDARRCALSDVLPASRKRFLVTSPVVRPTSNNKVQSPLFCVVLDQPRLLGA